MTAWGKPTGLCPPKVGSILGMASGRAEHSQTPDTVGNVAVASSVGIHTKLRGFGAFFLPWHLWGELELRAGFISSLVLG